MVIGLALIVPLIGLWLFAHPEPSYACSCGGPGSPSEELAEAASVFRGKVLTVRGIDGTDGVWSAIYPTSVVFDVKTVWKGPNYHTLYLETPPTGGSCGFPFIEGVEYVVYSPDGSIVSVCSRTSVLSEASHDLAELGRGRAPPAGALGPIAGLIALIAWLGLRKRRLDAR